jgi:hypothetical protein
MRRVGHEVMNKTVVSRYHEIQQREALIFTENLLRDSTNWYQEVHRWVGFFCQEQLLLDTRCRTTLSGVLSALYDIPPTLSCDDPLIRKCDDFVKLVIRAGYPGNHLVEYFTWMRYLPAAIAPWKRRANKIFEEYSALWMDLFREVERKLVCLAPIDALSQTLVYACTLERRGCNARHGKPQHPAARTSWPERY